MELFHLQRFQFQIGAIRGETLTKRAITSTGFNSKLVRLEAGRGGYSIILYEVSIPNWCD